MTESKHEFNVGALVVCVDKTSIDYCPEITEAASLRVAKVLPEDVHAPLLMFEGYECHGWFSASRFKVLTTTRFKVGDLVLHYYDENVPPKTVSEVTRDISGAECIRLTGYGDHWFLASSFKSADPVTLESPAVAFDPERVAPTPDSEPDAYDLHREKLGARLIAEGHSADTNLDLAVASAMVTEDTVRDAWHPKQPTHQERLLSALRAEYARASTSSGLLHPLSTWSGRRGGRRAR